ncbi:uncharacterized protein LOC135085892 [Ostrinia nubilalis]|uniref:uncharacterized protein LOC135085892 n=1 Tax=Ostrinia nubilalis TaxID=29057 RepID=UPI00308236DC
MHSLVLALIPRFAAPPPHQYNQPPANQQQDQNILYYKIVCNLLTFARNMIEHDGTRALFRPALHASGADAGPHLGALLALLRHARDSAQAYDKRVHTAQHQLLAVPTMTLDGECRGATGAAAALATARRPTTSACTRRSTSCSPCPP